MSEVYEYTPNPPCNLPSGPCEPCSELAQMEAQMDPGQKDLHVMHLAIRRRRNSIHCYINNLPYDIASYIFVLCLPPIYHPSAECLAIETPRLPLELCAVCHDWRSLALATPELWSRISIEVDEPPFPSLSQRLQLAGPAPLFIRLKYSSCFDLLNPARDTIAFVKQNLHRTRYLCLEFAYNYLEQLESQFKFDRPNAAPLLQELHVHCILPKKPYDLNLSILPPRPRRVSIDGNIANSANLNWDHVSHLTVGGWMSFDDMVSLLSKAKNVINFNVHLPITSSTPPLAMMTHSSIQILTIRHDRGNGSILLLSHSTLPSLEKLIIFSLYPSFFLGLSQSCLSFLHRSACHLKSLDITFEEFNTCTLHALEVLLLRTPTIQELSFRSRSNWYWPNLKTLLKRLRSVSTDPPPYERNTLLPHLRTFSYHGRSNIHLSLFLDIIVNRSTSSNAFQTHQPMDELVLHYTDDNVKLRKGNLLRILQLRAAGKSVFVGASCRDFSDCRTSDVVKLAMETYGNFVMPETYYGDWRLLENVIDDTL